MANEYLIKKWRLWFKALDRKHAGQLTRADQRRDVDAYIKLTGLEGESRTDAITLINSYWDEFVFHGKSGPVTEEQFIEMTKDRFRAGEDTFMEVYRKAVIADVKMIDQGGKGYITEEEFTCTNKSMGLENEAWNKMYYNAFNPKNGKVPNVVISDAWVDFYFNEDSSTRDVVLDVFEKYPDL
ncbi:sarcoplasmic calcium-binding protein-like [Mercenaria mercenaria]|uniref:sarcoplasmic calcium-binding protein-like n=1 Tax=Mercenaria mercenaria TaxID=6596 RepID=UPI00234EB2F8|nr:sarcoplasmic calcium-binding protein-like [Mercenaria mercenaria]